MKFLGSKLRGHGSVLKLRKVNLYRITLKGYRIMSAVLGIHYIEFPKSYLAAV